MPRGEREKPPLYKSGERRSRGAAPEKEFPDFVLDLLEGAIERLAARVDDNGPLRIQFREVRAHDFAHTPPYAIPDNGVPEGARRCETDMRPVVRLAVQLPALGRLHDAERGKQATGMARARIVDLTEVLRPENSDAFGKALVATREYSGTTSRS